MTTKTLAEMAGEYTNRTARFADIRDPDENSRLAFLAGARAMANHEAVKGMREALEAEMNEVRRLGSRALLMSVEAIIEFDALVKEGA